MLIYSSLTVTVNIVVTLVVYMQHVAVNVQLNTVVSGALDRLHYEKDPCVKYDVSRKLWIYRHRSRAEDDFGLFMVALCNRADHIYFHPVVCSSFFFFFPRLISAVGDWMSAILPHMVWP